MLVLASGSETRRGLLRAAHVSFDPDIARIDEESMKAALLAEDTRPRDVADALAEAKARKVSGRRPKDLVIGCDQALDLDGAILSKPETPDAARDQLHMLSGRTHLLHSAVVACDGGTPVWRHVASATLHMRPLGVDYIDSYVARNWERIRHAVGGYRIEEEGIRLFTRIDGDHFTVLGLPMFPLLSWLVLRGYLEA